MFGNHAVSGLVWTMVGIAFSWVGAYGQAPSVGEQALPEGALLALQNAALRGPGRARCLAVSPDSKKLASAHARDKDWEVILWDTRTGGRIGGWTLKGPNVHQMAFSPDAEHLAVGMAAARWSLCRLGAEEPVDQGVLPGGTRGQYLVRVGWAADGQSLYLAAGDKIRQWDLAKGQYIRSFGKGAEIDVSPDGKHLVAAIPGSPARAVIYDLPSGKPVGQMEMAGRQSICRQVAFSPDGAWAAAYFVKRDTDGTESIDLHHMTRGKVAKRIKLRRRSLPGNRICWLANSKGILIARDYKQYQVKWVDRGRSPGQLPTWPAATSLAVSPDGKRFYAGGAGPQIHAWDIPGQREVLTSQGHTEVIRTVAFFARDQRIVTAAEDGTCRVWDASTGRHLVQVEGPDVSTGLVKVPVHGRHAAWIDRDRVHFIRLDRQAVSGSARIDGKDLTHATADAAGRRFLAVAGNQVKQLNMSAPAEPAKTRRAGPPAQRIIDATSGIMVATGRNGYAVFDALAGRRLFALDAKDAPAVSDYRAMSQASDFFATLLSNQVWAYEVDTGQLFKTLPKLPARQQARANEYPIVRCLAVSPSGKLLAVGSFRGRVGVYDMYEGRLVGLFSGHTREVTALAFSADEKKLVSGSIDSSAIVWDLADLQPRGPQRGDKPFEDLWEQLATSAAAAVTARAKLVAAGDASVDALAEKLEPAQRLSPKRIEQLLASLDSPRFAERNAAYEALVRHGPAIVEAVTKLRDRLLAEARHAGRKPPAEKIRRLEKLIEQADRPSTASHETVRLGRAVRVLERIGTPKSLSVLKKLAQGQEKAHITVLAQAALRRIEYRRQAAASR